MGAGCAATVPESVYQADLQAQQSSYERRLRRLQESKTVANEESQRRASEAQRERKNVQKRLTTLELALADKQRLIDALDARPLKTTQSKEATKVFRALAAQIKALDTGRILKEPPVIRWRLPADVFFEQGAHRVRSAGQEMLGKLAKTLANAAVLQLQIEVAADSSGEAINEWELTGAQGRSLVEALSGLGVDPSRLSFLALGKYAPVASNESEEGRRENRRIDFVFTTLRSDPFQSEESVEGE